MKFSFFKFSFLSVFYLIAQLTTAQNIVGKIVDNTNSPLEYVSVAILNPKDSLLISYATTDIEGEFKLSQIPKGNYNFQVHLVGYQLHEQLVSFNKTTINLGTIILESDNELDEIVITAVTPVSIKNDTIAYDAKAFRVRPDDSVEDLLKKLPGMEVDADGKVYAQGEKIQKIYIDGKEFFSDDPSIAIKNLSADVIKKIEVIDESSNRARVSGVSDSERPKVINIKLKDDQKVNAFGRFQGGYGTEDRYLNSLNYNRFTKKFQASVIGKYNNINSLGSDISELMTFNEVDKKKQINKNDPPNTGFITTGVVGANFGYEFEKNHDANLDYLYNHTDKKSGDIISNKTEFINGNEIKSESTGENQSITNNHKANFNYRNRSNKNNSFELRGKLQETNTNYNGIGVLDKYNGDEELDLHNETIYATENDRNSSNIRTEYIQRFNDSIPRSLNINASISTSYLNALSTNYQEGTFRISNPNRTYDKTQETTKLQKNDYLGTFINLRYSEPLAEKHHLTFISNFHFKTREQDVLQTKVVNDLDQDPLLYELDHYSKDLYGGISYKFDNKNKLVLSTSLNFMNQNIAFGLKGSETQYATNFNYLLPSITARIKGGRGKFTLIKFRKNIYTPTISQLNPAINDFNPLNIRQGNPNLTAQENYSLNGTLNRYYFSTGFSFISHLNLAFTDNAIVRSEITDEEGKKIISFENYGNRKSANFDFTIRKRLKPLGIRLNARIDGGYRNYFTIINENINETSTKNGVLAFSIENDKKNTIDATTGVVFNKNYTSFSSAGSVDRDFLQQTYYAKIDWNIVKRFNLNSQFKYDIYTDSNFDTAQKIPIWNATLAYSLKKMRLMNVKFTALDILNKNIGLIRTSSDNYFQEVQREVLGNYYMLSLTFNLNNKLGNKKTNKRQKANRKV